MSDAPATLFDCLESPLPSEFHVANADDARRVMQLVGASARSTNIEIRRLRAELRLRRRLGNFAAVRVADMLVTMHMASGPVLRGL